MRIHGTALAVLLTLNIPFEVFAFAVGTPVGGIGAQAYLSTQLRGTVTATGRSVLYGYRERNVLTADATRIALEPFQTEASLLNADTESWGYRLDDLFGARVRARNYTQYKSAREPDWWKMAQWSSIESVADATKGQFYAGTATSFDIVHIEYERYGHPDVVYTSELRYGRATARVIVPYSIEIDPGFDGMDVFLPLRYRLQVTDTTGFGDNVTAARNVRFQFGWLIGATSGFDVVLSEPYAIDTSTSSGGLDSLSDEDYVKWVKLRDKGDTNRIVDLYVFAQADVSSLPSENRSIRGQFFVNPDELAQAGLSVLAGDYALPNAYSDTFFTPVPLPPIVWLFVATVVAMAGVTRRSAQLRQSPQGSPRFSGTM